MSLSRSLARFAHDLTLAAIPGAVQRLARLHLIDALGVGLGAAAVPAHRRLLEAMRVQAGDGPATVLGFDGGVPAPSAAMLNGISMHSLEYDDTHMGSIVHGGAVIASTALAAGEAAGLSLDEILRLTVVGWETLVRIGEASPGGFQRRGFQVTSVGGVIVAALLGAVADGADMPTTVAAMGVAGSQAGGIFEFLSNNSSVKALHPGWAAHSGLWAAALARGGMTGPETVLEGRFGLYATYADDAEAGARLAAGIEDLGRAWRLSDAAFKFYPCCHYIHPYLECAKALLPLIPASAGIAAVQCRVAPGAATVICEPWEAKQRPASGGAAKHSLAYPLARVLLGRPVDIPTMTASDIDPDALDLCQRIHWSPWDESGFPVSFDADLTVELSNGTVLQTSVDQVYGSAQRPPGEDEVRAKFDGNAAPLLSAAARHAAWDVVVGGGDLDDLRQALRQAGL